MTKLEELKAALEAATNGKPWMQMESIQNGKVYVGDVDGRGNICLTQDERYATFIALAHNMMPTLLKCASLVLECEALVREYPYIHQECRKVLEELK